MYSNGWNRNLFHLNILSFFFIFFNIMFVSLFCWPYIIFWQKITCSLLLLNPKSMNGILNVDFWLLWVLLVFFLCKCLKIIIYGGHLELFPFCLLKTNQNLLVYSKNPKTKQNNIKTLLIGLLETFLKNVKITYFYGGHLGFTQFAQHWPLKHCSLYSFTLKTSK